MPIGIRFTGKGHDVGELVRKRKKLRLPRTVGLFQIRGIALSETDKNHMLAKAGKMRAPAKAVQSAVNPKYWGIYMQ